MSVIVNGMDAERTSVEDVREDCPLVEDSPSDLITEDEYTEMKQTFLRMASYIDSLLICSDEQKETLMNFISQLAEYMPWRTETLQNDPPEGVQPSYIRGGEKGKAEVPGRGSVPCSGGTCGRVQDGEGAGV